jgi:glycosyltransferase involved in cell wall biosynthesis
MLGLLEAYEQYRVWMLTNHHIPWRLVILGNGSEKQSMENFIKNHGLTDHVTLAGIRQIDEIPTFYSLAKVFIHPALQDQWGLVVNEARASGLPVFVSKQSGCAEDLVRNGVNGFIFDPRNKDELVNLMIKATIKEMDLDVMGINSQRIIASWGLERFASGMYSMIEKVLQD